MTRIALPLFYEKKKLFIQEQKEKVFQDWWPQVVDAPVGKFLRPAEPKWVRRNVLCFPLVKIWRGTQQIDEKDPVRGYSTDGYQAIHYNWMKF